ncbi:unnamed protein product, partial [Rotaria socialis]
TTTTNSNSNNININNNQQNDDIPLLTSDSNKFPSSNLNPDASSFTLTCSTSDYYSQSDRPSSRSSSERSNSLSPSILSATLPLSYSEDDDDDDDCHRKNINDKRQALNLFIGDKILSLYGSNVDANNNQTSAPFNGRDIDPRDPVFIWNFAFYPDVSISPFVKRSDIKTLLERRVSLYSQ